MANSGFRCVCGHAALTPSLQAHSWARLTGYGEHHAASFFASEADARAAPAIAKPLAQAPEAGGAAWLRLGHPFVLDSTTPFWCFYEPPMMKSNGLEPGGDELSQVRLVRCQLTDPQPFTGPYGQQQAVDLAKVLETLSLEALAVSPAAAPMDVDTARRKLDHPFSADGSEEHIRQGDYLWFSGADHEADGGCWAILHARPDSLDLLVFGEWGFHNDHMWAGRVAVPNAVAVKVLTAFHA